MTTRPGPLSGCTIAITAHRRAEDLIASFERRGAKVLHAPTLQIVPVADDHALIEATRRVIANPPDDVVVTTAVGFRGWIEAADTAGLAADLLGTLEQSRILARGPKARGAIRAAGLVEHWSARSETTAEVVEWLQAQGVVGRKIVVQLHGLSDPALQDALRSAGGSVRGLEVYRWGPAPDPVVVERMISQVCAGTVDAVVHTSAPGAQAMLDAAALNGQYDDLTTALRTGRVLNACVGPVTAGPFGALGTGPARAGPVPVGCADPDRDRSAHRRQRAVDRDGVRSVGDSWRRCGAGWRRTAAGSRAARCPGRVGRGWGRCGVAS